MTLCGRPLLILGKRPIADSSEASAKGFPIGASPGFGGDDEGAKDDGGFFLRKPSFDDEAAELDLVAGILLAGVHGDAAEVAVKPDQEMTDAPRPAPLSVVEIVRR